MIKEAKFRYHVNSQYSDPIFLKNKIQKRGSYRRDLREIATNCKVWALLRSRSK